MDRVLANLTRSHREQPRDIWVIYCNPREEALFDRHGFARVADIPEGPAINWQGDRSIVWRLFSSPAAAATPAATADRNSEARKNLDLQNAETSGVFHGEVTSDTEMSQLKLSSLREFGSLEHPSGPVTKFCKKLRVRVRRTISASAGCSTSTRTGGHTTDCTLARRRPHDR